MAEKITKCCLCHKSLLTEWKNHDKCNVTREVLVDNGAKDIPTGGYTYHTFLDGSKKAVFPVCQKCYDKTLKKSGKNPKKPDTIKTTIVKKTKEPEKVTIPVKTTTKKK